MNINIKKLGLKEYSRVWQQMKDFTVSRDKFSMDELWFVEHPPVFTLGQAGKIEHLLRTTDIPIVKTDRGGQITYHGPGQLVVYFLLNLKKHKLTVRGLVTLIENTVIELLSKTGIESESRCDAPGVYADNNKICSLGLRIKNGCSYHGLALNVNMDLSPFEDINPCGFQSLKMTQIHEYNSHESVETIASKLEKLLVSKLTMRS